MRIKVIKAIAYPLFFILCLVYFTVQRFPTKVIQDRLEQEAQRNLGMKMTTGSLEILFPNGVELSSVRLTQPGTEGKPGLAFLINEVSARFSLLGLLFDEYNISFSADLLSGKLEGDLQLSPEIQKVDAKAHALDVSQLPIWQDLLNMQVAGKVTADIKLDSNAKDIKAIQGRINISLEKGSVGESTIKGLTVPPINLGKTKIDVALAKGKAEIKSFQIRSDDLEASMEGDFTLQRRLQNTLANNCKVRFRLTEDFLNRNEKFKDLLQLMGKSADGSFAYMMRGRLSQPRFSPVR